MGYYDMREQDRKHLNRQLEDLYSRRFPWNKLALWTAAWAGLIAIITQYK